ncbi:MAG: LamG-like jellyroll fold domain-containing protein [Bacteroidota bacterium]|jgi:hypothetical protein
MVMFYLKVFRLGLFFVLFFSLPAAAQLTEGLIGDFNFNNGKAIDNVSEQHIKASSVLYGDDRFGNSNSACYLMGNKTSYLNLGTDNRFKHQEMSCSIWFKIIHSNYSGNGYNSNPIILTKNQPGDDFFESYCIGYELTSQTLGFVITILPNEQFIINTTERIKQDQWYHVVFSFNQKQMWFYLNGKLVGSLPKSVPVSYLPGDSVMIGNTANQKNSRYLSGAVDDIRFYNRVLSENEITDLYNDPNPNKLALFLTQLLIALAFLIVFALIIYFVARYYKNKLRQEQESNKIQSQLYEIQIRLLKAQMNPHFVFNCMNTIQRMILEEDIVNANTYLVKFSRLLRKTLETNAEESISVDDECELLNMYIEMEAMRFEHSLESVITYDSELKGAGRKIPQMLVQPIAENAILHGLRHKPNSKSLHIHFSKTADNIVVCTVTDNGIGRAAAATQSDNLQKSLATAFIEKRLAILNKIHETTDFGVSIEDLFAGDGTAAGTKVTLVFPLLA